MRPVRSRYVNPAPVQAKKGNVAQIDHINAPTQGLDLSATTTTGDGAPVLTNFDVREDRIVMRAGFTWSCTHADLKPISVMIPWYGTTPKMAAATNHKIIDANSGADLKTGFNGDDWSWTSFANLGIGKYTVLVNGVDGVWSWDGGNLPTGPTVTVTSLSKGNPATCTVASTDISKFVNGQTVLIAGADASHAAANGMHLIMNVGVPANTFTLVGVDTSAASGAQTTGVTAQSQGSWVHEVVTAPSSATWVVPAQFQVVLSHQQRLWFADNDNLAVYYLPLQQKSGEVAVLPMNNLFLRGGSIRALATWTRDGGQGLQDVLCVFTTNGEVAIWQGVDPTDVNNFGLAGVYRCDAPMSKRALANWGGDLYVMMSTGVLPMTTILAAESEQLGFSDQKVYSFFYDHAVQFRTFNGWQIMVNPSSNRLICNIPHGPANEYHQLNRLMTQAIWSQWHDVPARCWGWVDPWLYFGDDSGRIYKMHPSIHSDDDGTGRHIPIQVDVQCGWSVFRYPGLKNFKLVRAHISTDGTPYPFLDVKKDYDYSTPANKIDITYCNAGAVWDTATWDVDFWAGRGARPMQIWQGVGGDGVVGAPRLTAKVLDAVFEVFGFDVIYEKGNIGVG